MSVEPLHRQNQSINYRVYALASSLSKGAMRFYQAKFGIALPEMRLLSTLGSHRRLSSLELVKLTAMDKGLVSRVLAGLAKRNLVQDVPAAAGASRRVWKLTAAGSALVARLRPVWQEREGRLQADLSPKEHKLLLRLLETLFHASEKLRAEEAKTLRPTSRQPGVPDLRAGGTNKFGNGDVRCRDTSRPMIPRIVRRIWSTSSTRRRVTSPM